MSHLNNQGQNSGQGYNNPNYKRNLNNRNITQGQGYGFPQGTYNTASPHYMSGYPINGPIYGYAPQGYVTGQGYIPQKPHNPNQHHHINVTTPNGEHVDVKTLSNSTPKANYATLNKYASASPSVSHKKTPSVTLNASTVAPAAPTAPAPSSDSSAKNSLAEQFKAQVAAKAAKAKAEAEAAKSQTESKSEIKDEAKQSEEKVETPVKEEVKKEAEIEVKQEVNEENQEDVKSEEPVKPSEPAQESKDEIVEPVSSVNEENKDVVEGEVEEVQISDKTNTIPETIEESTKEEEEEEEDESIFSISKFFDILKNAKSIENPFEIQYPTGTASVSDRLKEAREEYGEKIPLLRYDPVFLSQFAPLVKFPADKKFKEQIKFIEESRNERSGSSRGGSNYRNFGPGSKSSSNLRKFDSMSSRSNSRQGSKRRGNSNRNNDRRSNRFREKQEKEPELPTNYEPLPKSENRWIPKSRQAKTEEVKYAPDGVTVLLTESEIARKAKSLLNKLTLEYFDEITDELIEMANQSQWEEDGAVIKQVLEITFDKAVDEPHWSSMYAQFCVKLCTNIAPEVKDASVLDKEGKPLSGSVLVRKYLITKCQAVYEKGWSVELPTKEDGTPLEPEMLSDEYYKIAALKRRGLGLVRLIGHLYDLGLLSTGVIVSCLSRLIKDEDPTDDVVENLIQFVKTIGKKFDANEDTRSKLNFIFERMKKMAVNAKIPKRLQFALLDLIDLRNENWRGEAEKGPKTIKEIHEEENKKFLEEQRQKSERRRGGNGGNHNDSRSNSSRNTWSNSNRVNETDFQKVGRVGAPSSSALGPQNLFNGKSKNQKQSQSNETAPAASSPLAARENSVRSNVNNFHLLNEEDDDDEEEEEVEAAKPEEPVEEPVEEQNEVEGEKEE